VLELPRGADLEATSRTLRVTIRKVSTQFMMASVVLSSCLGLISYGASRTSSSGFLVPNGAEPADTARNESAGTTSVQVAGRPVSC